MPKLEDMKKSELIAQIRKQLEEADLMMGAKEDLEVKLKTAEEALEAQVAEYVALAASVKDVKPGKPVLVKEKTKPLYWPYTHYFSESNPPSIFGFGVGSCTIDEENDWIKVQVPVSRIDSELSRKGNRLFEKQEILDFREGQADDVVDDEDDDSFDDE